MMTSLGLLFSVLGIPSQASPIDFNRDIRPIISTNCFSCHGPDAESREADLRLDLREAATLRRGDQSPGVTPGSAATSLMYQRITSQDPAERMPPAKSGHELTPGQIDLLRRWIDAGAKYDLHWSFQPIRRPPLPTPKAGHWVRNPIDRFILTRLEAEGLQPNPPAPAGELLRRLSLDLTGLPPSPDLVGEFFANTRPDKVDRVIDRLLAAPTLGERLARGWLDLARYADSAGYGSDPLRLNIWPYRDWVIAAFNRNLPFDQFTIDQLAGDLLPTPMPEQRVATAFHRNTMTNTEGGTDDEEFRVAAIKDRIATTMQAWMGLTMGCAQCHSHKFDPITQQEYYQFFAIFNQTQDSDKPDDQPTLPLPTPTETRRQSQLRQEIADLEKKLPTVTVSDDELVQWAGQVKTPIDWRPLVVTKAEAATFTFRIDDETIINVTSGGASKVTMTIRVKNSLTNLTGLRLALLTDESLPAGGPGRASSGNVVITDLKVAVVNDGKNQSVTLTQPTADHSQSGFDITKAIDGDAATGWGLAPQLGQPHFASLRFATPIKQAAELVVTIGQNYGSYATLGKFQILATNSKQPIVELPKAITALVRRPAAEWSAAEKQELHAYFRPLAPTVLAVAGPLEAKKRELANIKPVQLPVMVELTGEQRRKNHLLIKGNYLNPGDEVTPGFPQALVMTSTPPTPTRLGVAHWLVDPSNPLTARVAVNRWWSLLFGAGLVETEEDFGTQGTLPTHPELLDWLATEFIESGWDVKHLLRTIVQSAAYQQGVQSTPSQREKDPQCRLLSRHPRRRLDAETLRDQALALSGLLTTTIGGPSVYPPQPDGLWRAAFNGQRTWATSTGADRYRRGLYTFWRRTVPYPSMATFDAPSRENCTLRRLPTNTPLQAFVTLNDPAFVEAAQALGRRLLRQQAETVEDRVRFALEWCLCRPASTDQIHALVRLHDRTLEHYQSRLAEAKQLATDPLGPLPPDFDAADAAVWTVIANVLLNLDGLLTKG